jgi:hypothetical protein
VHLNYQPRSQALSFTLLAGENTLAGAGHVYPKFWVAKSIIAVGGVVEESQGRIQTDTNDANASVKIEKS